MRRPQEPVGGMAVAAFGASAGLGGLRQRIGESACRGRVVGVRTARVRGAAMLQRSAGPEAAASPRVSAAAEQAAAPAAATATRATLLVSCPDQKGVVAVVAQLLFGFGCNIVESDQFTDSTTEPPWYFQRVVFDYADLVVAPANVAVLERSIAELADRYGMEYKIRYHSKTKRVAILASKTDHCLYDLLLRHRSGELPRCEVGVVISNHPTLSHVAEHFGVPYEYCPIDKDKENGKEEQEARIEALLEEYGADCIVLARYMQILTPGFCERHGESCINIHHSFLPSFEGARPYHRAHERGVKLIGATAHFVSQILDGGPIIHQSVTRVSHRDSPHDLIRKGKDLERITLATALRWFLEDRILVHSGRTVVFED